MQAQSGAIQGGMIGNFISIYQQEGTRGLWKVSPQVGPRDLVGLPFFPFSLVEFVLPVSIVLSNPHGVRGEEQQVP